MKTVTAFGAELDCVAVWRVIWCLGHGWDPWERRAAEVPPILVVAVEAATDSSPRTAAAVVVAAVVVAEGGPAQSDCCCCRGCCCCCVGCCCCCCFLCCLISSLLSVKFEAIYFEIIPHHFSISLILARMWALNIPFLLLASSSVSFFNLSTFHYEGKLWLDQAGLLLYTGWQHHGRLCLFLGALLEHGVIQEPRNLLGHF